MKTDICFIIAIGMILAYCVGLVACTLKGMIMPSCTKLKELLKEYEDARWLKNSLEQRFIFNTDAERFNFILRLNELPDTEYYLYQDKSGYKVEVFLE